MFVFRRVWDGGRQPALGVAVHLWFLQLENLQKWKVFLSQLPAELPARRSLLVLLLRSAGRARSDQLQLDTAATVRRCPVQRRFH